MAKEGQRRKNRLRTSASPTERRHQIKPTNLIQGVATEIHSRDSDVRLCAIELKAREIIS